jgi:hypothetical protein
LKEQPEGGVFLEKGQNASVFVLLRLDQAGKRFKRDEELIITLNARIQT